MSVINSFICNNEPVEAILSHVGNKLAFTDDLYNATESLTGCTAKDLIAAAQSTLYICTHTRTVQHFTVVK